MPQDEKGLAVVT